MYTVHVTHEKGECYTHLIWKISFTRVNFYVYVCLFKDINFPL